jgi:hypothetical protein
VWQCMYCGEYQRTYTELCRWCSSEAVVMVTEEDCEWNGREHENYEDCRLKSCYW